MPMTARLQVPTYRQFSTDVVGPERVAWLATPPKRVEDLTACWGWTLASRSNQAGYADPAKT